MSTAIPTASLAVGEPSVPTATVESILRQPYISASRHRDRAGQERVGRRGARPRRPGPLWLNEASASYGESARTRTIKQRGRCEVALECYSTEPGSGSTAIRVTLPLPEPA